jgi:hypothetical protein
LFPRRFDRDGDTITSTISLSIVVVHALIAVTGFVCLLVAAWPTFGAATT